MRLKSFAIILRSILLKCCKFTQAHILQYIYCTIVPITYTDKCRACPRNYKTSVFLLRCTRCVGLSCHVYKCRLLFRCMCSIPNCVYCRILKGSMHNKMSLTLTLLHTYGCNLIVGYKSSVGSMSINLLGKWEFIC